MSDVNSGNRFVLNFGGRPARRIVKDYDTQSQGFTDQDWTRHGQGNLESPSIPAPSIGTDTDYFCDRFYILTSGEKFVIGRYPFNCSDYLYNKAKGWCLISIPTWVLFGRPVR